VSSTFFHDQHIVPCHFVRLQPKIHSPAPQVQRHHRYRWTRILHWSISRNYDRQSLTPKTFLSRSPRWVRSRATSTIGTLANRRVFAPAPFGVIIRNIVLRVACPQAPKWEISKPTHFTTNKSITHQLESLVDFGLNTATEYRCQCGPNG